MEISVSRLSEAFAEPRSTVGRWVGPKRKSAPRKRHCPVSGDSAIIAGVRELCFMDRHRTYGYRRIHALLRRQDVHINGKTVLKIMRDETLVQPKVWWRPKRPHRVEKMVPVGPNQGWQIDMTSFQLAGMTTLFLVVVIDCYSRKIMG